MTNVDSPLEVAKRAASEAAQVLRELFETAFPVWEKIGDKGLITEADRRAEDAILAILSKETTYSILSEEAGVVGCHSGPRWVVDPLDGTTNFAHGIPFFGVSIALVKDSEIILGVVADPVHGKLFYAKKGEGAFLDGSPLKLLPSVAKAPTIIVDYGYAEADRVRSVEVTRRFVRDASIRKLGSSAVELTHLASGHFDAFICSGDEFWDLAAGLVIAEEAGCLVSDWKGDPLNGAHRFVLAARPELHGSLVSKIEDLQVIR